MLVDGSIKLTHSSFVKETGYGRGDARSMFGLFARPERGGVSIERAGEILMLADFVRTLTNDETGGKGEIRISNNAVAKFLSESAVAKSDSRDIHLSVLKVLP
ncbi:MAG: hypothetical protein SOY43_01600, partial [Parabacteroides sp.]|nr:hypothetical protein [bacterium]MDY4101575.1 hypothetical protein [Parabacteroides sp.]